jgi:hypothetical protein
MADFSERKSLGLLAFLNSQYRSHPATSLLGLAALPPHGSSMSLSELTGSVRRKAFFSFHFADSMRVNNVRRCWQFRADRPGEHGFTDSSLWEARQLEHSDSIKNLIREGVQGTSVVCVLVGSHTWNRRWVRYEIARAVIDNRGLLSVHINGLNHVDTRRPDPKGLNPLAFIGVCQQAPGKFVLYERVFSEGSSQWQWRNYEDYTRQIDLPKYLPEPSVGWVIPLSAGTPEYCFVEQRGHELIGGWIDAAARIVGR